MSESRDTFDRGLDTYASVTPICGSPDEADFVSRSIVLDAILLETIECRANHLQAELLKQQRERGICPYTLVLKDV